MKNREDNTTNSTKKNSIFVGLYMSVFSGGLLYILLRSFGIDGTPFPGEMVWLLPIVVGASIGYYAARFSLWVTSGNLLKQAKDQRELQ